MIATTLASAAVLQWHRLFTVWLFYSHYSCLQLLLFFLWSCDHSSQTCCRFSGLAAVDSRYGWSDGGVLIGRLFSVCDTEVTEESRWLWLRLQNQPSTGLPLQLCVCLFRGRDSGCHIWHVCSDKCLSRCHCINAYEKSWMWNRKQKQQTAIMSFLNKLH